MNHRHGRLNCSGILVLIGFFTTSVVTAQDFGGPKELDQARIVRQSRAANFPVLQSRSAPDASSTVNASTPKSSSFQISGSLVTVTSGLAVVLGLFAVVVWITRRMNGAVTGGRVLPREAVEHLGTTTLPSRMNVSLIRVGSKIVILGHSPQGVQSLTEITNVDEVQHLVALCTGTSSRAFAEALQSFEKGPPARGFVETDQNPAKTRRLFALG